MGAIPSYDSAMTPGMAFVFPGQGSQAVGMGQEFFDSEPEARALFEQAGQVLGYDVAALCLQGPAEQLNLTEYTQPALLTVSVVALRLLERAGLRPSAVAGHSLGEYTAVVAAEGLAFPDGVALGRQRGRYMQAAVEAGRGLVCALLGLERSVVTEVCRSEEHTSELQSLAYLVCRLLLEKKKTQETRAALVTQATRVYTRYTR